MNSVTLLYFSNLIKCISTWGSLNLKSIPVKMLHHFIVWRFIQLYFFLIFVVEFRHLLHLSGYQEGPCCCWTLLHPIVYELFFARGSYKTFGKFQGILLTFALGLTQFFFVVARWLLMSTLMNFSPVVWELALLFGYVNRFENIKKEFKSQFGC